MFLIFFFFGVSCFRSSCLCVCGVAGEDEENGGTVVEPDIVKIFQKSWDTLVALGSIKLGLEEREVGVVTTIVGLFGGLLSVVIGLTTPTPTVAVTTTTNFNCDFGFEREREGEEGSEIKGATAPNTTNFNCDFGFEREKGIELAAVKS